jgi:hypothetical protein
MSVRNAFVLFLALSTLALLVGCGSSSPTAVAPPSGAFSASSLNGTYVFSSTGVDSSSNGLFLGIAGTVVANGSGGITGGTIDIVGPDVTQAAPVAQPITGGSYSVSADGRGKITLPLVTLDFVLTSSSHGLITEFDGNGSGSGTIDLQSTVTLAQLAGSYAFSLGGLDSSGEFPTATAGSFALNSSGGVTGGVQDFNDNLVVEPALPILPGTATFGTGTGPGSITLTTATFGTLTFDYYPISTTHLKLIETDYIQFLAGDAFSQTGASIPTGPMVFTVAGIDTAGIIAAGGLVTSVDGAGTFTGGLEDLNNGGDVLPQLSFSGTPGAGGSVGGRVIVNLSGFTPASQYVLYPSSGGVLMLETDSAAITSGAAFAQTSQTLPASQGYGLNLSAFNTGGFEEDDIAEFTTSGSSFTGIVDINDEGTISFDQAFSSSTYNPPDSTGRGSASTIEHGNPFISYNFYVVNSSTVLLLETDTNQIGAGTIELQSGSASPGTAQARAAVVVHPVIRAHTASRRK